MSSASSGSVIVSGISKAFGGTQALSGVDLTVEPGEIVALVGHNGAGKSTLVKIMAGATAPDAGTIVVAGQELRPRPGDALRLGIRCVYQSRTLMPNLSVAENVAMTRLRSARRRRSAEIRLARERLKLLGSGTDVRRRVGLLSPGEAQEVEIARALDEDTRLLILDEPTASLSAQEVARLQQVMSDLKQLSLGQVLVSHDLDYVLRVADRAVVLRDGAVAWTGTTAGLSRQALLREMLGDDVVEADPNRRARPSLGDTMICAQGVRTPVLDDVSCSAAAGEVLGITGVIGSGIDELADVLSGATAPSAGRVMVRDRQMPLGSPRAALRRGVVLIPADRAARGLFENLRVGRQLSISSVGIGAVPVVARRSEARRARTIATSVELPHDRLAHQPGSLSGGNQQKVLVGRALDARPVVLVAHEPSVGVDVGARAAIHARLRTAAAEGAAVLIISSDTEEVAQVSDRVLVLRAGRVVLETQPGDEGRLVAAAMGEA